MPYDVVSDVSLPKLNRPQRADYSCELRRTERPAEWTRAPHLMGERVWDTPVLTCAESSRKGIDSGWERLLFCPRTSPHAARRLNRESLRKIPVSICSDGPQSTGQEVRSENRFLLVRTRSGPTGGQQLWARSCSLGQSTFWHPQDSGSGYSLAGSGRNDTPL